MRQTTVKINEKEYALQSIPYRTYLQIIDRSTNRNGVLLKENYSAELIKSCVTKPRVTLDDFADDFSTGAQLCAEIESFLTSGSGDKQQQDKKEG